MRGWFQDTRGISPVIGVVMMVAVAVLVGGIAALYVFGIGGGAIETVCNSKLSSFFESAC